MSNSKARLLIVDDEPSIRISLSQVLTEIGYRVRCAEDGYSALMELREEIPDILLTDLNMPGMCGFELLAEVRRSYPTIHTIAMSGAFCGNEVPSGVAADAFFQKGSSVGSLLRMMEAEPRPARLASKQAALSDFMWIQSARQGSGADAASAPSERAARFERGSPPTP
jgi:CheY-like chemotaxis protein